ncbi:MAG: YceI family protein [Silanimonas sp.]
MTTPSRPRWIPRIAAPLLALALSGVAGAEAAEVPEWRLDPTHSRVVFDVDHAGFSYSLGTLSNPTGRLRYDPERWDGAEAEIELALERLDFGDADWNRAMLGRRWFDAEAHPTIRFRSTRVEAIDESNARVHGELTVRGVSAPVVLDVRRNGVRRHPLTFRRTAGFSATAELDRNAFGLDGSPNLIGQTVRVRIEVEAVRARREPAASPTDTMENDDADPQHD